MGICCLDMWYAIAGGVLIADGEFNITFSYECNIKNDEVRFCPWCGKRIEEMKNET